MIVNHLLLLFCFFSASFFRFVFVNQLVIISFRFDQAATRKGNFATSPLGHLAIPSLGKLAVELIGYSTTQNSDFNVMTKRHFRDVSSLFSLHLLVVPIECKLVCSLCSSLLASSHRKGLLRKKWSLVHPASWALLICAVISHLISLIYRAVALSTDIRLFFHRPSTIL